MSLVEFRKSDDIVAKIQEMLAQYKDAYKAAYNSVNNAEDYIKIPATEEYTKNLNESYDTSIKTIEANINTFIENLKTIDKETDDIFDILSSAAEGLNDPDKLI